MANTIIELRRSHVSGNVPTSLANGEIAINTYDGKLFYRGGVSNTIQTIERFQGPAGLNTEIQFNDSGVLGADSGLTYNKTTDVLTVAGGAIVGGVNVTPQIQLAFTQANSAFIAANSAGVYANGAFAKANTQDAINLTQNNSITAAFAAANAATAIDTTQNNSITAAFTRANNSLNSNTGGTVTANTTFSGNVFLTGNGTTLSVTSNISFISPNTQNTITARMINGGTLSFSSNSGELFSITDSLAQGSIFSVNDISGLPIIDVDANGFISLVQYGGNVHIYNAATSVSNSTGALVVDGGVGVKGNVYADAIYDGGIEVITFANGAFNTANAAFLAANAATATDTTQNNSITAAFTAANSAGVYANGAFTQANSNYTSAVTKLNVTHSGSSAYLIDQYTGNNPSIYVSGGETIAFNLNVSGHPFVIRESSGGANTSTGLTHVSTTGVVSTGASAQGYVTGVLYWKVPFSLVGSTYVYQCTIHGGMVGNIVIQQPASFVAANTALAFNTANAAFLAANAATATDTTQNNSITAAFIAANSAGVYANGAFAKANTQDAINLTQNNSITAAFTTANSAGVYANGAFARANNSLNANTGGTVTANVTISANLTASNVATQTYIQFGDGSKQFTANAGSGGGGTTDDYARNTANAAFIHANAAFIQANTGGGAANSFGQIVANVGTILATTSNDSLQIIGESGISVSSNVSAKKVIVSVPAGFTFTTADYGFVTDSTNVIFDYGTL